FTVFDYISQHPSKYFLTKNQEVNNMLTPRFFVKKNGCLDVVKHA
ncbi:31355_t:CDS:2, partial [Racocetra persica]